jgi:hypothetical protein
MIRESSAGTRPALPAVGGSHPRSGARVGGLLVEHIGAERETVSAAGLVEAVSYNSDATYEADHGASPTGGLYT